MTAEEYTLEIVSRDKDHNGSVFQAYDVDGELTIGVDRREPFEIVLRNKTWNRIQVRLSVDGTDVLTGEKASTSPTGKMFLVEGRGTLNLKAWPEDNSKGARFVFGTDSKGVALNTHGDTSGVGVIAAAIFKETPTYGYYSSSYSSNSVNNISDSASTRRLMLSRSVDATKGVTKGVEYSAAVPQAAGAASDGFFGVEQERLCEDSETKCAVGAGETVKQELTKAAGLRNPVLDSTVQVRYEWWNDLQEKLGRFKKTGASANPFPGDGKNIDLSKVPKQSSTANRPKYQVYG